MKHTLIITGAMLCFCMAACQNMENMEKFEWMPTECAPELYPTNIAKAHLIYEDGNSIYVPSSDPVKNGWGEMGSIDVVGDDFKPVPVRLDIIWLSYTENKFWEGSFYLPKDSMIKLFKSGYIRSRTEKKETYSGIVIGMAPGGIIVVWMQGVQHQLEIGRYQAKESNITMTEYIKLKGFSPDITHDITEFTKGTLENDTAVLVNLKQKGFQYGLWDSYRRRYNLRPIINYDQLKKIKSDEVYMNFFNGEQDDLILERLVKNEFSARSIVKSIEISWQDEWAGKKQKYLARIAFNESEMFMAYKVAYGNNPNQQGELIVEINRGNDVYKVYLQTAVKKIELMNTKGEIYDNN